MKAKSYNTPKEVFPLKAHKQEMGRIRKTAKRNHIEQSTLIMNALDAYEREQKRLADQDKAS